MFKNHLQKYYSATILDIFMQASLNIADFKIVQTVFPGSIPRSKEGNGFQFLGYNAQNVDYFMYFFNILYNQKCQKINTRNYFREQDQENRIFATASKEYKRQKDFEKPRKNDRKRSMMLLTFYTMMACGQQRREWTWKCGKRRKNE